MAANAAPLQASTLMLTNRSLFVAIAEFLSGIPHLVAEYKQRVFNDPTTRYQDNHIWQMAVRQENREVLGVLHALSARPEFASKPQVQLNGIMGFALVYAQSFDFLEWIYYAFTDKPHRYISSRKWE